MLFARRFRLANPVVDAPDSRTPLHLEVEGPNLYVAPSVARLADLTMHLDAELVSKDAAQLPLSRCAFRSLAFAHRVLTP